MKTTILMLALAATALWAQPTGTVKKAAPAAKAQAAALELPSAAKPAGTNQWTYTDEKGQDWIYKRTPFGLTRVPKPGSPLAQAQGQGALPSRLHEGISVREEGDTIHFARTGPFGPMKWSKKRDELSEAEQKALEISRRESAAKTATASQR